MNFDFSDVDMTKNYKKVPGTISDVKMKNLFISTTNKDKREAIKLIERLDINKVSPKKEKQEYIPKNSLDIDLRNCDFEKLKKEMATYKHPPGGNAHHRAGILHHSIWTAKATEDLFSGDKHWVQQITKGLENYKNFTILAAFLHDIGKCDGHKSVSSFIKPKHDIKGYNMLINSCSEIYNILDKCIHPKFTKNVNKKIAFLAIIIKHHLDLGDVMQNKLTIDKYIDNIFKSLVNFPEDIYIFNRPDVPILMQILTIVQLADVVGARPYKFKSQWKALNEGYNDKDELPSMTKENVPWIRYGYETKGKKIVEQVINTFKKKMDVFFNINKAGTGSKLDIKTYSIGNYKIRYSKVPTGVFYFKAMNVGTIDQKAHQNYKNISWFGSESTADGYLESKHFGGFQYQFQTKRELRLIRLDDPETIVTFYALLNEKYKNEKKKKYLDIANKLQFGFGVGQERLQKAKQYMHKNFFKFDNKLKDIKRNSYHNIDIDIMNQLICPFGAEHNFDGYIASPFVNFHEEIALCTPWKDMKLVKLYKKYDFTNKCRLVRGGKKKVKKNKKSKKSKKK